MKKKFNLFLTVFIAAFLIALAISTVIAIALGVDALPLVELRNDFLFGLFIACVQLIWIGSDRNNKTYIMRTIVHFVILLTGCTLLMLWFGWLPPSGWVAIYYAGFIAAYIVIWLVCWNINRKKWKAMNERLREFKRDNME
ncbi:DUF3021 domain-containing protein [Christensenella intestinihominis]|uniref:DUF3021 domain-containing protein n=1 Tax=Christensenella intestinihominis TaxID=1851429 RepID=UPI000830F0A5|nr:DUF3021 domain-containing protein [Christensenella intestinihominis]